MPRTLINNSSRDFSLPYGKIEVYVSKTSTKLASLSYADGSQAPNPVILDATGTIPQLFCSLSTCWVKAYANLGTATKPVYSNVYSFALTDVYGQPEPGPEPSPIPEPPTEGKVVLTSENGNMLWTEVQDND
jgi:hypothetical protein